MEQIIRDALSKLLDQYLVAVRNTGAINGFYFLEGLAAVPASVKLAYGLHMGCSWRLEKNETILTGSGDYYVRAENNRDLEWEVGMAWGTLQREVLCNHLGSEDHQQNIVNTTGRFRVTAISCDAYGGFVIEFSDEYKLRSFPYGTYLEQWRLLTPAGGPHLILQGGLAEWDE